jgi:hypothetical protein
LKTFLTQIGVALPLTPDPPVVCFWKSIGWKDYEVLKNRNLESESARNEFFSPTTRIPTLCTRWTHPSFFRLPLLPRDLFAHELSRCYPEFTMVDEADDAMLLPSSTSRATAAARIVGTKPYP